MIIPSYWAEARRQVRQQTRSVTVRRFGWSDESESAAQAHAETRAEEALAAILAGERLPRRERLTAYGVEGVPIREQIVARHGDVVLTRNSYGAICLNTPDVLFADIDLVRSEFTLPVWISLPVLLAVAWALSASWGWWSALLAAGLLVLLVNALGNGYRRWRTARRGGLEAAALAKVHAWTDTHPDWHLRVYRTPAGLRLLAMQQTFAPKDAVLREFFPALPADGLYVSMCRVQQCFRARLTPKPWRIGMTKRIRPRRAAWSSAQAGLPERLAWIADYEGRSLGYAACRYVASYGAVAQVNSKAEQVRALHDTMTRAHSDLPLA